jgi:hypothetical protein
MVMGMRLADGHAYLIHVTVKAFRAILAFQLNGRVRNPVLFIQKTVNILDDVAGIAHLDIIDQHMGAQGMDTRSKGPKVNVVQAFHPGNGL